MSIVNPHDPASWPIGYNRPAHKLNTDECTHEQLEALHKVYLRGQLNSCGYTPKHEYEPLMTWGVFRDSAALSIDGTLMVYWCGMWLGIERDGYTHS